MDLETQGKLADFRRRVLADENISHDEYREALTLLRQQRAESASKASAKKAAAEPKFIKKDMDLNSLFPAKKEPSA